MFFSFFEAYNFKKLTRNDLSHIGFSSVDGIGREKGRGMGRCGKQQQQQQLRDKI